MDKPSLHHRVREFLTEVFSEWGSGVTGGISAPIFLLSIFGTKDDTLKLLGMLVAVVCVYVAALRVWKKEREAREGLEAQLYNDAMLHGKATVNIGPFNPHEDQTKAGCVFTISIDATNTGRTCTVGHVEINVWPPEGIFVPHFKLGFGIDPAQTVEKGKYFRYASGAIMQPGLFPEDLRASRVSVTITDGDGKTHTMLRTAISPRLMGMAS